MGSGTGLEVLRDEAAVGIDPLHDAGAAQRFEPPDVRADIGVVVAAGDTDIAALGKRPMLAWTVHARAANDRGDVAIGRTLGAGASRRSASAAKSRPAIMFTASASSSASAGPKRVTLLPRWRLNVIGSYPLSTACHERVVNRAAFPIRFFTLKPSLKICLRDRGKRPLSDWEQQRIRYHYDGGLDLEIGVAIDNSNITIADCACAILRMIEDRPA
jgi:hypothetical protein